MSWHVVEASWKQFKDRIKAQRRRHGDVYPDVIAGHRTGSTDPLQNAPGGGKGMTTEALPQRRVVLRGGLAFAAGLCVPFTLSGCDSKKAADSASPAPASPPAAATESAAPAAAPSAKVSQASVQYQTQPKGEQKCGVCQHFNAGSNSCELVDGQISPEGWCRLWAQKA